MLHWAEVAIEQERRAREAREQLERDHAAGENLRLSIELHPAMIAVAASGSTMRGFKAALHDDHRLRPPRRLARPTLVRRT